MDLYLVSISHRERALIAVIQARFIGLVRIADLSAFCLSVDKALSQVCVHVASFYVCSFCISCAVFMFIQYGCELNPHVHLRASSG